MMQRFGQRILVLAFLLLAFLLLALHPTVTWADYPQEVLGDNPAAYFRLDESSGPIASDSAAPATTVNLTPNPSFENGLGGWNRYGSASCPTGSFTTSSSWSIAGNNSADLSFTTPAATWYCGLETRRNLNAIPVLPSTPYHTQLIVDVVTQGPAEDMNVALTWYDASGVHAGNNYLPSTPATVGRKLMRGVLTSPANAAFVTIIPFADGSSSGTVRFRTDAVLIRPLASVSAERRGYVDGDSPGGTWDGTAHASSSSGLASLDGLVSGEPQRQVKGIAGNSPAHAYRFTNHFVELGGPVVSTDATIEGWFKPQLSVPMVLLRDNTNVAGTGWILPWVVTGNLLAWRVAGTTYTTTKSALDIVGRWTHIVLRKEGSTAQLYIDGQLIDSRTGVGSTPSLAPWQLMRNGTSSTSYTAGGADEIAVYTSALPEARIIAHYQAGADQVAPETQNLQGVPTITNQTSHNLTFSGTDNHSLEGFECKLDSDSWSSCSSGHAVSGLADGQHTVQVRAVDEFGNRDISPAQLSFTVDTAEPMIAFVGLPSTPAGSSAQFSFSANEAVAFQCSLDGGPWNTCGNPLALDGLASGSHELQVRATDLAGNQSALPLKHTWTADADPPQTTLIERPPLIGNSTVAAFSFSSDQEAATFECSLDGGPWVTCASPFPLVGLASGSHEFRVRAIDAAGNADSSPAQWNWQIDTEPPLVQLTKGEAANRNATVFFGSPNQDVDRFECQINDQPWTGCVSPIRLKGMRKGAYRLRIVSVDSAGNRTEMPAEYSWDVSFNLKALRPPLLKRERKSWSCEGDRWNDSVSVSYQFRINQEDWDSAPPRGEGRVWCRAVVNEQGGQVFARAEPVIWYQAKMASNLKFPNRVSSWAQRQRQYRVDMKRCNQDRACILRARVKRDRMPQASFTVNRATRVIVRLWCRATPTHRCMSQDKVPSPVYQSRRAEPTPDVERTRLRRFIFSARPGRNRLPLAGKLPVSTLRAGTYKITLRISGRDGRSRALYRHFRVG